MGKYDDIINLPHHVSPHRRPMPMENRAAQFAPFAALIGYEESIAEAERTTQKKFILTNEEKIRIENLLRKAFALKTGVHIIYFDKDPNKEGGSYLSATGVINKIDEFEKYLYLNSGIKIYIPYIKEISNEI